MRSQSQGDGSATSATLFAMADPAEKEVSLELIAAPAIEKRILAVRQRQVMLDEDLADLYGVETRRLVEQVKRNQSRFPEDFKTLRHLISPPPQPKRPVGFRLPEDEG